MIENAEGIDLRDIKHKKIRLSNEGAGQTKQYGDVQNVKLE